MRRKLFSEKTHQLVCVSPISSQVPKDLVVLNLPKKCSHLKSFKLHLLLNWTELNDNPKHQFPATSALCPETTDIIGLLTILLEENHIPICTLMTFVQKQWHLWFITTSPTSLDYLTFHFWMLFSATGRDTPAGDSDSCALSFEKLFSYCCLVLFVHLCFFLFVAKTLVLSSKTCDMECL